MGYFKYKIVATTMRLRKSALACCLFFLVCLPSTAWCDEAALRVALVYNIMKFITWPDIELRDDLSFCVFNPEDDSLSAVEELKGKLINGHAISVSYLSENDMTRLKLSHCDVLYLNHSHRSKSMLARINAMLPERVVFVVDEPHIDASNISIALVLNKSGRVEFEINAEAVHRAGVNISSQLLKLARNKQRVDS